MPNKIFNFISRTRANSKFLTSMLDNKSLIWMWNIFRYYMYTWPDKTELISKNIAFFKQNKKRTEAITNVLADTKSKKVYNKAINFLQTFKKKDYPLLNHTKVQYFTKEIKAKLSKEEVFLDCGAAHGDSIDDFLKYCPNYQQIISFEPETPNFERLTERHQNTPNTKLINAGVWDSDGTVSFSVDTHGIAHSEFGTVFAGGGDSSIQVNAIDSLNLDKVTFIKMDIEGAELNALKGAEKTILRDKPKLAICIYHSNEDRIDIPEYIHNLVPEYKLYVRQHMSMPSFCSETVLYAIM